MPEVDHPAYVPVEKLPLNIDWLKLVEMHDEYVGGRVVVLVVFIVAFGAATVVAEDVLMEVCAGGAWCSAPGSMKKASMAIITRNIMYTSIALEFMESNSCYSGKVYICFTSRLQLPCLPQRPWHCCNSGM